MKRYFTLTARLWALLPLFLAACSDSGSPVTEPEPTPEPEPEAPAPAPGKLSGRIIGSQYSVDYDNNNAQSTTVNVKANVFDGDFETIFASYDRSGTWVGYDLVEKHVITEIAYSPRISRPERVQLAVIEGANKSDFSDALPIYLIKGSGTANQMTHATVNCSRGFRYVRYVTPDDARCNLAELAFYGYKGEGDDSRLYQPTNLPLVVINTKNAQDITSRETEISSTVYIVSEGGTKLLATEETGVRGRGNNSWSYPKKPYRLKFAKKQRVLDAPAEAKKWTLVNSYGDKTLMRNILAFEVSRRIGMAYTPYCHPVDVILNGEYKGCYQLCDQIDVRKERVDITEMAPADVTLPALSGGYLIEIDAYATGETSWFYSAYGNPVTIKSPDDDEIVAEQRTYINDYFNRMETALYASDFTDETTGYRRYLDLDSFLKHFIVGELCGNTDTYWSVYMSKDRNSDRLMTGPVWDFDLAFENDNRTYPINGLSDFIYATKGSVAGNMRSFVNRIVKQDAAARSRLVTLWKNARKTQDFSESSLLEYVEETAELLQESQALNFKRWPILSTKIHQNYQALGSYDKEVEVVKSYIRERLPKMDALIGD